MHRGIPIVAAFSIFALIASSQQTGRRPNTRRDAFPPDIFDNRSLDAARIAPDRCVVEINNERMRVLRVKLPVSTRVPIHGHRSGLVIALTDLHLRLTAPDRSVIDIQLPAGDMRWIDAGIHAWQRLGAAAVEYLFIESKG